MSILLLHGFTGHPSDLEPLKIAFEARGLSCNLPLLPGHGTMPENLNHVKISDWLDCAKAYDCDMMVGLSMGGLLASMIAIERPKKKLILLSPAFFLQPMGRLLVLASRLGLWRILKSIPKTAGSDIADPIACAKSQAYHEIPLKALLEFDRLRRQALKALPQIRCPLFSFFGAQDHTIDVKKASLCVKNSVILKRSAHILPLDYDQKELITQCLRIFEK